MRCLPVWLVVGAVGIAHAEPSGPPAPAPPPAPSAGPPALTLPIPLLVEPTPKPVPSLRIEAARVAAERYPDWRYPDQEPWLGLDRGLWYVGYGGFAPRTKRSAALRTGSVAATLLGEILLSADSPLAGVGAMLTGATLDAAADEEDRAAETRGR